MTDTSTTTDDPARGTPVSSALRPAASVLGVDVGGTGIKAVLAAPDGRTIATYRVPTPRNDPDARELADVVASLVAQADTAATGAGSTLRGLGLVVPGVVDDRAGRVRLAVNLGWTDLPVRDRVTAALPTPLPVAFGQDVRAGALAETAALGEPSGTTVFLPVGTGLASALVVDGDVVASEGWAGEVGQVRIAHGPHVGCRVEEIASAGAVARRAGAPSARAVADRVRAGDRTASAVWQDCVDVLADVVAWTTAVSGCDTVVVGGGLAESGDLLLTPLRQAVGERLVGLRVPDLRRAQHGDAAGALGAVLMARRALGPRSDVAA